MLREVGLSGDVKPIRSRRLGGPAVSIAVMATVLVLLALVAISIGRFPVPFPHVVRIVIAHVFGFRDTSPESEQSVVWLVRLPRVLLAMLIGGGLGISGAALQAVFRNPLVSPDIIGVSSGASFGGALSILLGFSSFLLVTASFAFGLIALVVLFAATLTRGRTPLLMVVLGGVVTGAFFSALVSLITYVADPFTTLPAIVFWLLGSVAAATYTKVLVAVIPILVGTVVLLLLRWRLNVLSLGDEDAASLGLRPARLRWVILAATSLIVAGAVAVSGVVGWVGLVIPHAARMAVGPDHRHLLMMSFLMGAAYVILIDTLARTMTAGEIPLGVLTALIGAPVFFYLLRRNRERIWDGA